MVEEEEEEVAQILEQSTACVHWYRPANKQRPAAAKLTPLRLMCSLASQS